MKTKIELDLKSLVIGAAAAAVVVAGSGATGSPGTAGRFAVKAAGTEGKVVVVDTLTGQCWTALINGNGQAVGAIGSVSFLTPKVN